MNRKFDSGLRAIFLHSLERDLRWAELGVLGDVVMPTRWTQIRRRWHYPGNGSILVNVISHDLPAMGPGGGPGGSFPMPLGGPPFGRLRGLH